MPALTVELESLEFCCCRVLIIVYQPALHSAASELID